MIYSYHRSAINPTVYQSTTCVQQTAVVKEYRSQTVGFAAGTRKTSTARAAKDAVNTTVKDSKDSVTTDNVAYRMTLELF